MAEPILTALYATWRIGKATVPYQRILIEIKRSALTPNGKAFEALNQTLAL